MILRIEISPEDWPNAEGVCIDRFYDNKWHHVGLYGLRKRSIDINAEPGDRVRAAGFKVGEVPHGAPLGVTALVLSDYIEVQV